MSIGLVGYTGFVGQHILKGLQGVSAELKLYNSSNIKEIHGERFDTLFISAIQAKKWWANKNPIQDKRLIEKLMADLRTVTAKTVVFISSVDVYDPPTKGNESTILITDIHPYGANRLMAEKVINEMFSNVHIVRLQGLVGEGLQKNYIYDLRMNNNLDSVNTNTALQWYPMDRLMADINIIIENNIPLINLAVEPVETQEILSFLANRKIIKNDDIGYKGHRVTYNIKSNYSHLFKGKDGYIVSKEESLNGIMNYMEAYTV